MAQRVQFTRERLSLRPCGWAQLSVELQEKICAQLPLADQARLREVSQASRRIIDETPSLTWSTQRTAWCLQQLSPGPLAWSLFGALMRRHRTVLPHLRHLVLPPTVVPNEPQVHDWFNQLRQQATALESLDLTYLVARTLRPVPLAALRSLTLGFAPQLRRLCLDMPNLRQLALHACPMLEEMSGRLPRLLECDLLGCRALLHIPWQTLARLQRLNLHDAWHLPHVDLSGMAQLGSFDLLGLHGLQQLRLHANAHISSLYLAHFRDLRRLEVGRCHQLRSVDLTSCEQIREVHLEHCLALRRLSLRHCASVNELRLVGLKRLEEIDLEGSEGIQRLTLHGTYVLRRLSLIWQDRLSSLCLARCPRLCCLDGYSPWDSAPIVDWRITDCPQLSLRGRPLSRPWLVGAAPGPCRLL